MDIVAFLYVIGKSNITLTRTYIIALDIKGTTISNFLSIHIVEIPTNKGANTYKLNISKIGN